MTETAPAPATTTGVAEIQWLRMRRRTAITDAEHSAVHDQLRQLARDLEQRPDPVSPTHYVVIAVVIMLAGVALGWGLYLLADAMWVWLNS